MSTTETTADKLEKLASTKQAIKEAIIEKGGIVESDVFDTFPDAIRAIPASGSDSRIWYYGYDLDINDQNPETRVSYPSDVDNADFEKARMDFANDVFRYGGWNFTPGEKFMPRPCMLKYDKTVDYYLDPSDYSKKEDGSASDVANVNYAGNAMMEWGKIYVKRWGTDTIYHFRCSNAKLDDGYECWSNYDLNNNEIEHFYTAIYYGTTDNNNRMRSISGVSIRGSETVSTMIANAERNGKNSWYIAVLSDQKLFEDLTTMMVKSTDSQSAIGKGNSNNTTWIANGSLNEKGIFWGSSSGTNGVKVFGMENLWGNRQRLLAGLLGYNYKFYIKMTRGTKDGSTGSDYTGIPGNYIALPFTFRPKMEYGYISETVITSYGRYQVKNEGSSTTYDPDALGYNSTAIGSLVLFPGLGADAGAENYAGLFSLSFRTVTDNKEVGSSMLSCKPLALTS